MVGGWPRLRLSRYTTVPPSTAMTPSLIKTRAMVRFGTLARVRRARSQNEVAAETSRTTPSITQPAQSGMLLFWIARICGICTRYRPPAPMTISSSPCRPRKRPRVTTKDGMPTLATKNPMNVPIRMPIANAIASATTQFTPCTLTSTMKMHIVTPAVTPADRSISPSRMTKTSAMPSMTSVAACVMRFAKLRSVRKNGLRIENRMLSTTKPATAGRAPMSPPRTRWNQARTWSSRPPSWPLPMRSSDLGVVRSPRGSAGCVHAHALAPVGVLVPVM